MTEPEGALSLDRLSWIEVAAHLARDARLLIPVGALEQHGGHLPLGSNALIARRLTIDLSEEFGVLRAPTVYYGVNVKPERPFAGTASMTKKTLHRALNELLACWEEEGIRECILVTAHRHEPHLDSLATLYTEVARIRVVQAWDVEVGDLLEAQPAALHADEAETSVMLHLYPGLVRMDRARDTEVDLGTFRRYMKGQLPAPPPGGAGSVGRPTAATAQKGEAIYRRILDAIRRSVFLGGTDADDTDSL